MRAPVADRSENIADKVAKGRQAKGNGISSSKLSLSEVQEIRALYATGEWSQNNLAEKFSVERGTIGDIVRKEIWRLA